jgi:hypothetical protein
MVKGVLNSFPKIRHHPQQQFHVLAGVCEKYPREELCYTPDQR